MKNFKNKPIDEEVATEIPKDLPSIIKEILLRS